MTQGATPEAEETLYNVALTIDNAGEHVLPTRRWSWENSVALPDRTWELTHENN